MKKALRIFAIFLLVMLVAFISFYFIKNESLPEGQTGSEADAMAQSMLKAMNEEAWNNTKEVSWTFRGAHDYTWDREENMVTVEWTDHAVILNPETQEGVVTVGGESINPENEKALITKAWDFYNNDSFWLAAPYKVFDPGTERSIVTVADGRKGLMVTYTSGGSTPGDSYVWILGEDNRPVACKMWTAIIPIGGIEFTWENYQTLSSGALVATQHLGMGLLNIDLTNLK